MNSTISNPSIAIPDSPNVMKMLSQLAPKVLAVVRAFREGTPTAESALAFEKQLAACLREGGRELVEAEFNDLEPAQFEDCPVRLQLAGEEYKRRRKSPNVIGALFGPITLQRYRYEALERGERGIIPLEMHLGIEAGLATPALAERIGLQAADHTQQQVLHWLQREHGIHWSVDSLRMLLASLSEGLGAFSQSAQTRRILALLRQAAKSKGPHRPVLAVGRDGIMIPMRHGAYQEASTATISVMDRRGKRLGSVYLGQMPEPGQHQLSCQLTALLSDVLAKWKGCELRCVYITDAGHHPQEYFEKVLKKMPDPRRPGHFLEWQWIVDFWHACCYLTKMREALFGGSRAGRKWFKRMRHWLRHRQRGISDVLRSATQQKNLAPDPGPARNLGYLYSMG